MTGRQHAGPATQPPRAAVWPRCYPAGRPRSLSWALDNGQRRPASEQDKEDSGARHA
jgi:hypothetical protein